MHVLHVTECYDGGVSRAIDTIADLYPEATHSLIAAGSEKAPKGAFKQVLDLGDDTVSRIGRYRRALKELEPDIVHAHSSWAGFYTRLLPQRTPIVYQPHCFVFDDPYRSRWERLAYFLVEKALARRTRIAVALSMHELNLARALSNTWRVLHLTNTAAITPRDSKANRKPSLPVVTMVGRVARQKSPEFFAETARLAAEEGLRWRFRWIGDGDAVLRAGLTSSNVEVTGWLRDQGLLDAIQSSTFYYHTAAYEGFPLSVLDAASCGVPVIARDIPCFQGTAIRTIKTPEDALAEMTHALGNDEAMTELRHRSATLTREMSRSRQIATIRKIYSQSISSER